MSSTGMRTSKDSIVFVEHREVSNPGCGSLLLIRASSGRRDRCGDLGDSCPFVDSVTPIVCDGLDALCDVVSRGRRGRLGLGLISMFNH